MKTTRKYRAVFAFWDCFLQIARTAETVCAAGGVVKFVLDEIGGVVGCDYELGNALFVGYQLLHFAVIVKRYDNLTSIIAVDDAHFVGGCKRAFACKTATRIYQSHHTFGYGNGNAGVDKDGFVRFDYDVFAFARIQVRPRRIRRAVLGDDCVEIEFFDFHRDIIHNVPCCAFGASDIAPLVQ